MSVVDPYALLDRVYVSQFDQPTFGLVVHIAGVPADPDGATADVSMETDEPPPAVPTVIFAPTAATYISTGTFEFTLTSAHTQTPGLYKLIWSYDIAAVPQTYESFLEVGAAHPDYDALSPEMKALVEQTYIRFRDLYDSPYGGPHLQVYFQTAFGRGRMAQLLRVAVGRLNTIAQPHQTYDLTNFPLAQWGALLEQALYVEILKHLMRSYVEQPDPRNVSVAWLDRRDYLTRWQTILDMEEKDLRERLETFKIASMNLGSPGVLVSGGVYGRFGPTRLPGSAAARPRYYYSFY